MGPGVDPHLYQATARDVRTFQAADVIFYSGFHLEGQLGDVLERLSHRIPTVGVAEAAIPEDEIIKVQNGYGHDPHVWMDPGLWAKTVPVVASKLIEIRPDCADEIEANAAAYREQIEALDRWARESVATIPEEHRILVTAHDAFNYFGRAYGFRVVGLQGVSTISEAALADMASLVDFIKKQGVKAIFVETSVNPAAIKRVAEDAGVGIGGELFSDALGGRGETKRGFDVGTYEGMVRYNLTTIADALK